MGEAGVSLVYPENLTIIDKEAQLQDYQNEFLEIPVGLSMNRGTPESTPKD